MHKSCHCTDYSIRKTFGGHFYREIDYAAEDLGTCPISTHCTYLPSIVVRAFAESAFSGLDIYLLSSCKDSHWQPHHAVKIDAMQQAPVYAVAACSKVKCHPARRLHGHVPHWAPLCGSSMTMTALVTTAVPWHAMDMSSADAYSVSTIHKPA